MAQTNKIITIKPKSKWQFIDFKEIWEYRELLLTFVQRDLKVRYRQTVIGGMWAIIQPFTTMVIFSFFFGRIAQIPSDGVPYPIFSYAGLVLWTYFAQSLSSASASVVSGAGLYTKVYFPRIIIPITEIATKLIDYFIALIIVFGMMVYYQIVPPSAIVFVPLVVLLTALLAAGMSFWIGALNVKYRDVGQIVPFFLSLMMYATPVIYPVSIAPNLYHLLRFNPMTGIIEAHRAMLIGSPDINFFSLGIAVLETVFIFITGALYFKSVESKFADIV